MTPEEIKKANEALNNITLLEKFISVGGCDVSCRTDFVTGCGLFPCRMEMVRSLDIAQDAATAVMKSVAYREIQRLKDELSQMGVASTSNPSHHDGAASAPSVDGVVLPPDPENQSERK